MADALMTQDQFNKAYGPNPVTGILTIPVDQMAARYGDYVREYNNTLQQQASQSSVSAYEAKIPTIQAQLQASGLNASQIGDAIAKGEYEAQNGIGSYANTMALNAARADAGIASGLSYNPNSISNSSDREAALKVVGLNPNGPYDPSGSVTGHLSDNPNYYAAANTIFNQGGQNQLSAPNQQMPSSNVRDMAQSEINNPSSMYSTHYGQSDQGQFNPRYNSAAFNADQAARQTLYQSQNLASENGGLTESVKSQILQSARQSDQTFLGNARGQEGLPAIAAQLDYVANNPSSAQYQARQLINAFANAKTENQRQNIAYQIGNVVEGKVDLSYYTTQSTPTPASVLGGGNAPPVTTPSHVFNPSAVSPTSALGIFDQYIGPPTVVASRPTYPNGQPLAVTQLSYQGTDLTDKAAAVFGGAANPVDFAGFQNVAVNRPKVIPASLGPVFDSYLTPGFAPDNNAPAYATASIKSNQGVGTFGIQLPDQIRPGVIDTAGSYKSNKNYEYVPNAIITDYGLQHPPVNIRTPFDIPFVGPGSINGPDRIFTPGVPTAMPLGSVFNAAPIAVNYKAPGGPEYNPQGDAYNKVVSDAQAKAASEYSQRLTDQIAFAESITDRYTGVIKKPGITSDGVNLYGPGAPPPVGVTPLGNPELHPAGPTVVYNLYDRGHLMQQNQDVITGNELYAAYNKIVPSSPPPDVARVFIKGAVAVQGVATSVGQVVRETGQAENRLAMMFDPVGTYQDLATVTSGGAARVDLLNAFLPRRTDMPSPDVQRQIVSSGNPSAIKTLVTIGPSMLPGVGEVAGKATGGAIDTVFGAAAKDATAAQIAKATAARGLVSNAAKVTEYGVGGVFLAGMAAESGKTYDVNMQPTGFSVADAFGGTGGTLVAYGAGSFGDIGRSVGVDPRQFVVGTGFVTDFNSVFAPENGPGVRTVLEQGKVIPGTGRITNIGSDHFMNPLTGELEPLKPVSNVDPVTGQKYPDNTQGSLDVKNNPNPSYTTRGGSPTIGENSLQQVLDPHSNLAQPSTTEAKGTTYGNLRVQDYSKVNYPKIKLGPFEYGGGSSYPFDVSPVRDVGSMSDYFKASATAKPVVMGGPSKTQIEEPMLVAARSEEVGTQGKRLDVSVFGSNRQPTAIELNYPPSKTFGGGVFGLPTEGVQEMGVPRALYDESVKGNLKTGTPIFNSNKDYSVFATIEPQRIGGKGFTSPDYLNQMAIRNSRTGPLGIDLGIDKIQYSKYGPSVTQGNAFFSEGSDIGYLRTGSSSSLVKEPKLFATEGNVVFPSIEPVGTAAKMRLNTFFGKVADISYSVDPAIKQINIGHTGTDLSFKRMGAMTRLLDELTQKYPDYRVVVTTATDEGRATFGARPDFYRKGSKFVRPPNGELTFEQSFSSIPERPNYKRSPTQTGTFGLPEPEVSTAKYGTGTFGLDESAPTSKKISDVTYLRAQPEVQRQVRSASRVNGGAATLAKPTITDLFTEPSDYGTRTGYLIQDVVPSTNGGKTIVVKVPAILDTPGSPFGNQLTGAKTPPLNSKSGIFPEGKPATPLGSVPANPVGDVFGASEPRAASDKRGFASSEPTTSKPPPQPPSGTLGITTAQPKSSGGVLGITELPSGKEAMQQRVSTETAAKMQQATLEAAQGQAYTAAISAAKSSARPLPRMTATDAMSVFGASAYGGATQSKQVASSKNAVYAPTQQQQYVSRAQTQTRGNDASQIFGGQTVQPRAVTARAEQIAVNRQADVGVFGIQNQGQIRTQTLTQTRGYDYRVAVDQRTGQVQDPFAIQQNRAITDVRMATDQRTAIDHRVAVDQRVAVDVFTGQVEQQRTQTQQRTDQIRNNRDNPFVDTPPPPPPPGGGGIGLPPGGGGGPFNDVFRPQGEPRGGKPGYRYVGSVEDVLSGSSSSNKGGAFANAFSGQGSRPRIVNNNQNSQGASIESAFGGAPAPTRRKKGR